MTSNINFCPVRFLHRNLSDKIFPFRAAFVVSIPPCRNNSGKISPKFLESGKSRCTFAVANKKINKIIISKIKTQVPEGH